MVEDSSDSAGQDERLCEVLLDFLESSERGLRPDSAELLARHPDIASELMEFFETQDCLDALSAPLREWSRANLQSTQPGCAPTLRGGETFDKADPVACRIRTVGNYEVLEEIGRGGMGVVYKARDKKLGRLVAVKMIRSANQASAVEVARFLAEARAKARLDHPNVVPVYEIGECEGQPYFVMALIEGGSLHSRLAEGPLPVHEAAHVMWRVAEAIQHAHGRGVLHRDLKPHNILLQTDHESPAKTVANGRARSTPAEVEPDTSAGFLSPVVSDFGLARLAGQDGLTATGEVLGTPNYMPPEQASGEIDDIGPRSDVYSLGAVLYCLVTGRPPFQAATMMETLRLVQDEEPVPPRRLNSSVTRDLEAVCLKCLEKEPGRRYASAADLAADLRRVLDGRATLARPLGSVGRVWRWARRRPARAGLAALSAAAVLAVAAGSVAYTVQLQEHNLELGKAREKEQKLKEEAELRGRLLQLRAYSDGIRRSAESWENLRRQMGDQVSGRPVPDVFSELPQPDDYMVSARPARMQEDLRDFEWYYLRRVGSGLRVWRGHKADPVDVCFSRDGRLALSAGGSDGTARLWDADSSKECFCFRVRGEANAVALSPDARFVALAESFKATDWVGDKRGELHVWDRQSGEEVAGLSFGASTVTAVAFAPDGSTFAALGERADREGIATVWEVATWRQRFQWHTKGGGSGLCISADSCALAEAMTDDPGSALIRIHDLHTGQVRSILQGRFADSVTRLAFAPDGRTLASGSYHGGVVLWDVGSGSPRKNWNYPARLVSGLSFSPDGGTLAVATKTPAGSNPGRAAVQMWDTSTGRSCSDSWGPGGLIHNLAMAPDGSVALACGDSTVRVWNPERLKVSQSLPASHKETWTVAFSPDGQTLASGGDDNKIRLWDVAGGRQRATLVGHFALVSSVAFHPGGRFIASASYDNTIRLWDVSSGSAIGPSLRGSNAAIRCLAFAPDGHTLATSGRDHNVHLWDVRADSRGQPVLSPRIELTGHREDILGLAFSPDGQLVASTSDDRTIRLWQSRTGSLVRTIEETVAVRCVAFAPDGRLAWGTDEGEVKIAATAVSSPITVLAGHAGRVRTLTFTPGGRTLASAGDDHTVRLWEATTGQSLMTLRGHDEPIYAVSFTPSGRSLATACHDGSIRLWPAE